MKKKVSLLILLTSTLSFAQNLVEDCAPANGNIQMTWYPMSQYTNPASPAFVYTEGNTTGDPNIALLGFQIPMVIYYDSEISVTENFEIRETNDDAFSQTIIKNMGSSRNFQVRLKYGLSAGNYIGTLTTTTSYFPNNICTYTLYGRVNPATASVDNNNIVNFKLYPNPVSNILNFSEETDAEIFSIQGSKISEYKNVTEINISNLSSGIYLLKTSKFGIHKFVKK